MHVSTARHALSRRASQLFINRNFALLWGGQSISQLGDMIFDTTMLVWIASELARGRSWASLAVAAVSVAAAIPVLLVGPIAGVFVDRWNKRRTMLAMDALSAFLILLLLPVAGLPLPFLSEFQPPLILKLSFIYVVILLMNIGGQFHGPASTVLLRDIVDHSQQPQAASLKQGASSLAMLVGPPIGATMLFAFGPQWALLLQACSFLVSFLAVLAIRVTETAAYTSLDNLPASFIRDLREGLRFFVKSPVLRVLAVTGISLMLTGGVMNTLDIFFVTHNLHAPASWYGFLSMVQGIGMILGAILAGLLVKRLGLPGLLWTAMIALGLLTVVYSRLTSFIPAAALTVFIGMAIPAVNIAIGPIMLQATPRDLLGRVSATLGPIMTVASLVGMVAGGFLYSTVLHDFRANMFGIHFGPLDTAFLIVSIVMIFGGLYAMLKLVARFQGVESQGGATRTAGDIQDSC